MTTYVITYRLVKGSPITEAEYDGSLHNLDDRVTVVEGVAGSNAYPTGFEIDTSGHLIVTMSNGATIDAGPMPESGGVATSYRGQWQPSTLYHVNDLFSAPNGNALGAVLFDHVSGSSFDWGANDGLGHNYYIEIMPASLPAQGTEISTATFTPTIDHANMYIRLTHPSGCAVTIDPAVAFADWTELYFRDASTDTGANCTFAVSSPGSINGVAGFLNQSQGEGSSVTLKKVGSTNAWDIFGRLALG